MVTAIREKYLDQQYRETSWGNVAQAPIWAINGVSREDGECLKRAFYIETIQDLAENKFIKIAQTIVSLAQIEDIEG